MAKLMDDEFAPVSYADDLDYWQIPKGLARCAEISWGAKVLYGVIYGNAYKYSEAKPSYKALQKHMGYPSKATMQRWIKELVDARLIRTIQRGRGISNIYRMRRSPLVGNMTEEEFNAGEQFVYAGGYTKEPVLVDELTALQYYYWELDAWADMSVHPNDYPLPKPYFKTDNLTKNYIETKRLEVIDRYLFEHNTEAAIEFELADVSE